jgi:hypothetical protein
MNKYANVVYNPKTGHIEGLENNGSGQPTDRFSAIISLFAIRLAMDVEPKSIGLFMSIADGYGSPGFFPGGYDWSGIRDSSDQAIDKMFERARQILFLRRLMLAEIGLPRPLLLDLQNTSRNARR